MMPTEAAKPERAVTRRTKPLLHKPWQAGLGVALIALVVWAGCYFTSEKFRQHIREVVISRLERATGGRVELGDLRWNLSRLEIEADNLTIHGTEPAGEVPLAHADRFYIRLKLLSLAGHRLGVRQLTLSAPVVHIITNPDGSTNLPGPPSRTPLSKRIENLFDFAADHVSVYGGAFLWNQRRVQLDFSTNNLVAKIDYDLEARRYDGALHVGKVDVVLRDFRPIAAVADARVSLFRDHLQITELKVASERSHLELRGNVLSFQDPHLSLDYHLSAQLSQAGSIMRVRSLHSGVLESSGHVNYSLAGWNSAGKLTARDSAFDLGALHLREVSGGAEFTVDRQHIRIPHIFAHVLGGSTTGDAEVTNYLSFGANVRKEAKAKEPLQQGRANFKVNGISVAEVARALRTPRLPLEELKLSGTSSGQVAMRWNGPIQDAVLDIVMQGTPTVARGGLPVALEFDGKLDLARNEMRLAQFKAFTPGSQLTASGVFSQDSNLSVSASTSNFGELRPFIAALRGSRAAPLPVELAGPTSFVGTAHGRLSAPSVDGHFDARDLTVMLPQSWFHKVSATQQPQGAQPATAVSDPSVHLPFDTATGELSYSPEGFQVRSAHLHRRDVQVDVDANLQLTRGSYTPQSRLNVRLGLRDAQLSELQFIAGYHYPLTGRVDLNVQIAGLAGDIRASGYGSIKSGRAWGEDFQSLAGNFDFGGNQLQFHDVRLHAYEGELTGSGGYNPVSQSFDFHARGSGFRLEQFAALHRDPRVRLSGQLQFEASGTGTLSQPVLNAALRGHNLAVNGKSLGNFNLDAVTAGTELKLTGRSAMPNITASLDGSVRLRDDMPANARLILASDNLNPLLEAFSPVRVTGPTTISMRASVSGPLRRPKALFADIQIEKLTGNLQGIGFANDGPVSLQVSNEVLHVERCRMSGEGSRFMELRGTAELGGDHRISMRAGGDINLKLLQTFDPDLTSSGSANFRVNINGTVGNPTLQGRVKISNGAMSYIDLPNGLSDINGSMVFNQDRLEVENLVARSGGGQLKLGGFLTFMRPQGVYANLTASGKDIRIRYPEGVSSTANANLSLVGSMKNAMLSGDITVTRVGFSREFDFAMYLARSKQSQLSMAYTESPLSGLHLDLHVVSTPELQVQTSLARIAGNVDLHVRGTALRPVVLGRANILDGDLSFNATKYHVERGDITFTNPVRIEPNLDVEASAHVRDYDITLGFHGTLDKLNTTYRSDPPLPTGDIIALLALGRTREEEANPAMLAGTTQSQTTLTETASNALLGQALNAAVSSRVQKIFGVSRIKIDPQVGGPENNPNARLTIEQEVSNRVTLTYITNLSQSAQQVIQFEYNVNREVSIVALRDQTGVVSVDVRIRKRKR